MNKTKAIIFLFFIFLALIILIAERAYQETEDLEIQVEKMTIRK
jgi:hypothetical protein